MIKKLCLIGIFSLMSLASNENAVACRKDLNARDIFSELGGPCHSVGDPVNPVNGNMHLEKTDYILNSPNPINMTRYYNSQLPVLKHQPFGRGWSSIFNIHLSIEQKGNAHQQICLHDIDGKVICFNEYKPLMLGADPIELWSSKENTRLSLLQSETGFTLKFLDNSSYLFDKDGLLIQRIDPEGHSLKFLYHEDRIAVTDNFGYQLTAHIDHGSLITAIDLPDGNQIIYGYENRSLTSVSYPNTSAIYYSYDENGNLSGVSDGQHKPVSIWAYDHKHRVTYNRQIRDAGYEDAVFTFAYKNHLTDSYWDFYFKTLVGLPRSGAQEYDFASHKALSYPIEYTVKHFDRGQLIEQKLLEHKNDCHVFPKEAKSEQVNVHTDYDDKGLLRQRKIASGSNIYEEINYQWNQHRLPEEVKYSSGLTVKFGYNPKQRPQRISSSDGQSERVWQYTYNDKGLPLTAQAPYNADAVIRYEYNDKGKLSSITNELGHKVTYDKYDALGNLSLSTNENGVQTQYEYDALGLPVAIKTNGTDKIQLSYDQNNAINKVVSAEGVTSYYDFNYWGDLRSVKDEQGNRYVQNIDPMGNIASKLIYDHTGKLVYKKTYEYDSANRLHHQGDGDGNDMQTYFYKEKQFQPVYSVNRKEITDRYTYGASDRLTRVEKVAPEGERLNYLNLSYDALGYIKSVDTEAHHTTYVRNVWGDIISLKRQGKGEEQYTYNDKGRLETYEDNKKQQFKYQYDVLNRITKLSLIIKGNENDKDNEDNKNNKNNQFFIRYFYDQGNYAIGKLNRIERQSASYHDISAIDYAYSVMGNLSTQIHTIDNREYKVSYDYNKDQQITSVTYPSGLSVNYHYNQWGKIDAITSNQHLVPIASAIEHMPFGSVKSLVYGNQLKLMRDYDLSYRLTQQKVGEIEDHYTYDELGNITSIKKKQLPQESKEYSYDLSGRISAMQSASENQSFTYHSGDGAMREKTSTVNGRIQLSQYSNQLSSYTDDKNHRIEYDKNGNVIELGNITLGYDEFNNLINVSKAQKRVAEYQYNPLNQRITKVVDGKKTIFIYDQFGKLIEIITPHTITDIIYLDDQPIAQIVNGSTYYFVNHVSNTPMYLLDQQGNESWRANIKPFEIDANGVVEQNLRFPGQYHDEETGFYYNNARYYHPKLAQYLQPETMDVLSGGSFYAYAYANYNPVNVVDITGENPFVIAGIAASTLAKAVWRPIAKAFAKGSSEVGNAAAKSELVRKAPQSIAKEAQANKTGQICANVTKDRSFFDGASYSPKVLSQMKKGDLHSFPESVRVFEHSGSVSKISGGDGIVRDILKIPGSYKGKNGTFEFMKEPNGLINHRFFKKD